MDKLRSQRGFSVLELMIAMAIGLMTISAVFMVSFSGQSTVVGGETNAEAVTKAQQLLEQQQALGRQDFNLVNSTSSTDGIYTKTVTVTTQSDFLTKLVTTAVSWTGDHKQALSTTLSTLVTNLDDVNAPNTCSSVVTGNWKNIQSQSWDFSQLLTGPNGNGFGISNIQVLNKRIYVTMYTTPNTNKNTLMVFDISGGAASMPVFLGGIDNDAASSVGPNALAIASTTNKIYAYLASPSSFAKGQLQVVDVTDPTNMSIVKTFKIPVAAVPTAGAPLSIFYKDGYIYLGLAKTSAGGDELNIIDVGGGSGSPSNPIWKGGYVVGNAVNEISIRNNYVYIATANAENMTILDVSNPASPVRAGGYTPPNAPESNGVGSNHGETVFSVGNTVYLGRTYGTNEFYILNAANPASVSVLSSQDTGAGSNSSIYGLSVRNTLAFFVTNTQFQVWDISNPAAIKPWTSDGTTNTFFSLSILGGTGTAADCENNSFYLAVADSQGNNKDVIGVIYPGP